MKIEQVFSETDLLELEQVFSKSMEPRNPMYKKGSRQNKVRKQAFIALAIILFGCSVTLYFLRGELSSLALLSVIVGAISLLVVCIWSRAEKMLDPMAKSRIYERPFTIVVTPNSLYYREKEFLYTSIRYVVDYKNILFLKADKRWLVIKADEEEKAVILSKLDLGSNVQFEKKEEPFDLRKL